MKATAGPGTPGSTSTAPVLMTARQRQIPEQMEALLRLWARSKGRITSSSLISASASFTRVFKVTVFDQMEQAFDSAPAPSKWR